MFDYEYMISIIKIIQENIKNILNWGQSGCTRAKSFALLVLA